MESDGRLQGDRVTETVPCSANVCRINVPAPSFALVYLNSDALAESGPGDGEEVQTFATTTYADHNTATIASEVLETSNGRGGAMFGLGGTSRGIKHAEANAAAGEKMMKGRVWLGMVLGMVLGVVLIL